MKGNIKFIVPVEDRCSFCQTENRSGCCIECKDASKFRAYVIIDFAPISDRMWKKGDKALLDSGKIRIEGNWFDFDDRFEVTLDLD